MQPGKKALVVGISKYQDKNLPQLDFCQKDGVDMNDLLTKLGYEVVSLIGEVNGQKLSDAIIDFFSEFHIKSSDTLLFYFSGHGIPDVDGDHYLATTDIDPYIPNKRGFSFDELTKMMQKSVSKKVIAILDSCYSGAAKVSKGNLEDVVKLGSVAIQSGMKKLEGEGRCLLAASQSYQEAYGLKEAGNSLYTYFLLEGLKGNKEALNEDGDVTPYTLNNYVYNSIFNSNTNKRPKQKPIAKIESSGTVILASYPQFESRTGEKIDNEPKKRGMELIQAELEGLKNEIEKITQIRKQDKIDLQKIKIKSKRSIAHALYRKDKLLGFTTIYGQYFTPIMDVIPEICQNVELFVNAVDENDQDWYFNFIPTIELILYSFPSYKEKMNRLPKVVPPGNSHIWLTCENCGQFPGINIVTTDDGTFLQCGNCKHFHKGKE